MSRPDDATRQVMVYTPDSSLRNPVASAVAMFSDLWAGRELAWRLAVRDISAQYRQTAFGLLWAFILPVANAAVWIFLGGSGIVSTGATGLPYPVYVFAGTMLWSIFMDAAVAPLQQTTAAKPMLAKINFPREALIVSGIYQVLFNAAIKLAVLVPAVLLLGVVPDGSLLLLPLGVLSLVVAGTAFGLLLTPVGMLYGDIGKSFPLVMQFLMYLTPVVFVAPSTSWAGRLIACNPLTPLIETSRAWLTGLPVELAGYFCTVNLASIVLLLLAWMVYRVAMPILVERMSA